MKHFSLSGPYSVWETQGPVPFVVLGPNKSRFVHLSNAVSRVAASLGRRSDRTNFFTSFAWALNQCEAAISGAACALEASYDAALDFHFQFLAVTGAKTRWAKGGNALLVCPARENHARVERAISALGRVTSVLAGRLYDGRDPGRVESSDDIAVRNYWDPYDTGRRFRVRSNPERSPRSNDPRIFDRWLISAERTETALVVIEMARFCRRTGCRFVTAANVSLADLFFLTGTGPSIPGVSKGSNGERVLDLVVSEVELEDLRAFAGEMWPTVVPRLLVGKSPYTTEQLLRMPVFPIGYQRYKSEFSRAAADAGLYYPKPFRGRIEMRLATPQQLRHEFVFEQLSLIELRPIEERALLRDGLARLVGWASGESMLTYYSHFYEIQRAIHAASQRTVEAAVVGPTLFDGLESSARGRSVASAVVESLL